MASTNYKNHSFIPGIIRSWNYLLENVLKHLLLLNIHFKHSLIVKFLVVCSSDHIKTYFIFQTHVDINYMLFMYCLNKSLLRKKADLHTSWCHHDGKLPRIVCIYMFPIDTQKVQDCTTWYQGFLEAASLEDESTPLRVRSPGSAFCSKWREDHPEADRNWHHVKE